VPFHWGDENGTQTAAKYLAISATWRVAKQAKLKYCAVHLSTVAMAEFRSAGHWPTLVCAFLSFSLSCMAWMVIGVLGNSLAREFRLSPGQKGLMVATPVPGGAILRIVMGNLTDRIGARRTALIGLTATSVPLLFG
jgi:nitrate/nitrite transporter NarK